MSNAVNPIVNDIASLRAGIASVSTLTPPTHEYPQPQLETPVARTLDEFVRPLAADPAELLKHRYLCRGGALLLVGATGLGKSSLAMQLMIKWALGQSVFGLEPTRSLKSLLIQAENDDGDLAEMKEGVFNGLNLSEEEQTEASKLVLVTQESSKTGTELSKAVLDPLLHTIKPDLLWLDPALAYIGGDMNSQKDVGKFLRTDVAPLLIKHNCAAIIIHHTNKISKDPEKQTTDPTYLGAGSAEWINSCRAMLALRKTEVDNLYELIAAKRGDRLKWRTADGESLSFTKYIGHCKRPDTICWIEMAIAEAEELRANNGKSTEDVLKHVPQDHLIAKDALFKMCSQNGVGKHKTAELLNELIEEDQLFEVPVPRAGKKPKVLLSRQSVTLDPALTLDSLRQNSQGHYIICGPEPAKKME
jgi:energy-coupling factor transporter ATP-binding protein EcfA2